MYLVVYGHDSTVKEQLERMLEKLELDKILITNDTGRTIIESLEQELDNIGMGIVLMTPDDLAVSKDDFDKNKTKKLEEADFSKRPRQNVILEMGMLLSKLGREKVIVLKQNDVTDSPSDLDGIFYIGFKTHIKEKKDRICQRLQNNEYSADLNKLIDW